MSIISILPSSKSDAKEVLEDALKWADGCSAIMIIALNKEDGSQIMRTSTMSGHEKAFMVAFAQAWLTSWFKIGDVE